MKHKRGALNYLTAPLLEKSGGVLHAFLTREGGLSPPPFSSLNFSVREGDCEENVARNRALAGRAVGFDPSAIITLKQVHGDNVVKIDASFGGDAKSVTGMEADGLVTNQRGLVMGILTADCVPTLLYAPASRVIGAVHAGWRGTVRNIVANALSVMAEGFGVKPEEVIAAIGPAIGPCCYEVDGKVLEALGLVSKQPDGKGYVDLKAIVREQLITAGVVRERTDLLQHCTCCEKERFFSYRREGKTGRMLSLIQLI